MLRDLHLPMPGEHNVLNALAAVAVATELAIDERIIRAAFSNFAGVKRRFTRVAELYGVTVIDDYAHHPVEIRAVLKAAREAFEGRVIAVVQPHRYSRLRDLFEDFASCFNNADQVLVSPVYGAGEAPIGGIDRDALVRALRDSGHRDISAIDGPEDMAPLLAPRLTAGDVVICLGAGSISTWAHQLPHSLGPLMGRLAGGGGAAA